ncbi:unnamed protein product [Citrullus colocynthis]|uniref:Uncharacterized protein n=1 Tax=Citrullus colocynthis TaxID=252529 RepID=A0ABP0YUT5_9ROSI
MKFQSAIPPSEQNSGNEGRSKSASSDFGSVRRNEYGTLDKRVYKSRWARIRLLSFFSMKQGRLTTTRNFNLLSEISFLLRWLYRQDKNLWEEGDYPVWHSPIINPSF